MTVTYSNGVWLRSTPQAKKPFVITRPFTVTWERPGKQTIKFTVEEGFTTDLASIPRVARSFIPQVGKHLQAAVGHDLCYERSRSPAPIGLTRAEADSLFLEGMKVSGVWWLRRRVMYAAVRTFGGTLWGEP